MSPIYRDIGLVILLAAVCGGLIWFLPTWLNRWILQKRLKQVLASLRAGDRPTRTYNSPFRIALGEDGFQLLGTTDSTRGSGYHLRWADVKQVFAHKVDDWGVDTICIGFRVDEQGRFYDVDEDMSGYEELLKVLPEKFKSIREDWFKDVAFPPFAPCLTHLWGQPFVWEGQKPRSK